MVTPGLQFGAVARERAARRVRLRDGHRDRAVASRQDQPTARSWPLSRTSRRSNGPGSVGTDSFFDLIVLISVLMFLVLAAGVGMLALQATLWR